MCVCTGDAIFCTATRPSSIDLHVAAVLPCLSLFPPLSLNPDTSTIRALFVPDDANPVVWFRANPILRYRYNTLM